MKKRNTGASSSTWQAGSEVRHSSATVQGGTLRMVSFNGVNHLAMATGDMDKTIRFWRDLLGMRLVAGLGQPGYRHYFFQISETDLIAFFEWTGVKPVAQKEHGRPVA